MKDDKKNKKNIKIENISVFSGIIKGLGIGYAITAAIFIIYACLITYTQMTEKNIHIIVMLTTTISVLAAGITTASGAEKRGWLYGMLSGFLYVVIMIMIGVIISPTVKLGSKTFMLAVLSLAGGGLGGIIGINIKK